MEIPSASFIKSVAGREIKLIYFKIPKSISENESNDVGESEDIILYVPCEICLKSSFPSFF